MVSNTTILCPYHDETTPSCSVDLDKGVWMCHGCQRSGLLYDLARSLGCSIKDSLNRDKVFEALQLHGAKLSAHRMMMPTRAVHSSDQIRRMWKGVQPTSFGLGYAASRIDKDILAAFGVDYMCGLVLFRDFSCAHGYWSESLGQVREAYPDGRYYSMGSGNGNLRVLLAPPTTADNWREHLLMVEGPFDALSVVQAVGLDVLSSMRLCVGATCGGDIPDVRRDFGRIWTMFDVDGAGAKYREKTPWAEPIALPAGAEDPADAMPVELAVAVKDAIEGRTV